MIFIKYYFVYLFNRSFFPSIIFPFFSPVLPLRPYILNVDLKCVLMQFLTQILLLHIWLMPGVYVPISSASRILPATPPIWIQCCCPFI